MMGVSDPFLGQLMIFSLKPMTLPGTQQNKTEQTEQSPVENRSKIALFTSCAGGIFTQLLVHYSPEYNKYSFLRLPESVPL